MEKKLNNGVMMPMLGFGTFLLKAGDETYQAVIDALKIGYRHIDTAKMYGNEQSIGRALKDFGIDRSKVFEHAYASFLQQLTDLQTTYVD